MKPGVHYDTVGGTRSRGDTQQVNERLSAAVPMTAPSLPTEESSTGEETTSRDLAFTQSYWERGKRDGYNLLIIVSKAADEDLHHI